MRTLLLVLACIGAGFAAAQYQVLKRTNGVSHFLGESEDMEEAVKTTELAKQIGKIEVVGGNDLDFGIMRRGTRRTHTFVFKNVGGAPVSLELKSTSCKCTIGNFKSEVLNPDEKTNVELEWLAEKGGDEFSQSAVIATDAFGQQEIKLTIHGRVGESIVFDPPRFNFGEFQGGEQFDGEMYSFEESPLNIVSATCGDPVLADKVIVEMSETIKLEKGQEPAFVDARYKKGFRVKLLKGIPAGNYSGNILFTKQEAKPEDVEYLNFQIRGRRPSDVGVVAGVDYDEDRNIFTLGSAASSDGLKKSFMIKIRNGDAKDSTPTLRVESVSVDALKVSVGEPIVSAKQRIFPVLLEVPPGTAPIEVDGKSVKNFAKIVLETNVESTPSFPMYIKFRIQE